MNRTLWIEGLLILIVAFVTMVEGLRLVFQPRAPGMIYDSLGPGGYLFILSLGLLVTGAAHLIAQYRKTVLRERVRADRGTRMQLWGMMAALAIYISLIDRVGYAPASIVFFLVTFRMVGIKSWPFNMAMSLGLATIYYVVFVKLCDLVFPQGNLFG